mmetsp:Transcript_15176/g.26008  ORF Transcript_15176/g.26008 Transcript_15176/m.26008 type:complete len:217 (-) Transcript_15176:802-1452(-)|eukprot:CAMPEP_0196655506 /NCGR_PEP_ID=MMETSP1086-20130531/5257_1 /TAXON_ID=77921 /ORGANISM="Cyanoptyche  gloeocystis , Strain SAG4.97" /LENGTH=216 /DNA_ID=CAMNT_0041987863 /DNA_START=50 /DNA_END=700 /DNA_ORIENTATION=-
MPPKNAFEPGGRAYEKRKGQNRRRGGPRKSTQEEGGEAEQGLPDKNAWKYRDAEDGDSDEEGDSEEGEDEAKPSTSGEKKKEKKPKDHGAPGELPPSSDEEESDEEESDKRKGVSGLIDIQNPNRAAKKFIKASDLDPTAKPELSRREREEIEKQRAKEAYMKLHLAGKTDEAKADLSRLAAIRKEREEAQKKRDEEKKGKEEKPAAKPAAGRGRP